MSKIFTGRLVVQVFSWASVASLWAAQSGPVFPPHRFPTDQSFHLGYNYGYLSSSENFVSTQVTEPLPNGSKIALSQHSILAEYQPDRALSVGAILHYDSITLSDESGTSTTKKGLGDQRLFGEYRFWDRPGYSLGAALLVKFPLYSNPTYDSLQSSRSTSVALLGDAQTDFTVLGTSEFWPVDVIRIRADLGYTYRTEHYAGEFPFLASVAFVKPRFDVELRMSGNLSQKNDSFDPNSSDVDRVRGLFAGSQYAYAKDPWVLTVNPHAEFWLTSEWAAVADFKRSLVGENSPQFWEAGLGLTYRWSKTEVKNKKRIREVDINTDQEEGRFQGEENLRKGGAVEAEEIPSDDEATRSGVKTEPEEEVPTDEEGDEN